MKNDWARVQTSKTPSADKKTRFPGRTPCPARPRGVDFESATTVDGVFLARFPNTAGRWDRKRERCCFPSGFTTVATAMITCRYITTSLRHAAGTKTTGPILCRRTRAPHTNARFARRMCVAPCTRRYEILLLYDYRHTTRHRSHSRRHGRNECTLFTAIRILSRRRPTGFFGRVREGPLPFTLYLGRPPTTPGPVRLAGT